MFTAAVVQLCSTADRDGNWRQAERWIRAAAADGARLVVTPENTNYLGPHSDKARLAEAVDGPTVQRFADLARELQVHLLLGSFNERSDEPARCYNTSVLFGPDGSRLAVYRKLHLFDVDLGPEVSFVESRTVKPGDRPVVASTSLGAIGLSICYDLRFPELYRELVRQGAELLMIPAAFTVTTGIDHWHTLVRARAIECQSWVLAPAQVGEHGDGEHGEGLRRSFGHSLIVDPWGRIRAELDAGPGVALAAIDLDQVADVRRRMPLAAHRVSLG